MPDLTYWLAISTIFAAGFLAGIASITYWRNHTSNGW